MLDYVERTDQILDLDVGEYFRYNLLYRAVSGKNSQQRTPLTFGVYVAYYREKGRTPDYP